MDAVDGDDHDVLARRQAGFLNGLNRAQGHVVIVSIDGGDVFFAGRFQEGGHHFLAFADLKVAVLTGEDFHVGIFGQFIGKALVPIDGGSTAGRALKLDDLGFAIGVLGQPVGGAVPFFDKIGGDERHIKVFSRADAAIDQDNRNLCALGFAKDLIPAGLDARREDDGIDALGDEGPDRLNLLFLIFLRIRKAQIDMTILCLGLDRLRLGGAPIAFLAFLREADDFATRSRLCLMFIA